MMSATILLTILFSSMNLFAQSPAQWDFKTKKINDSVAELVLHCKLSGDWHIYCRTDTFNARFGTQPHGGIRYAPKM